MRQVIPSHNEDVIVVLLQIAPEALNYKKVGCTGILLLLSASIHQVVRRLITKPREVSKPRDRIL